ncbi:MAG: hypothetical protein CMH26_06235 [Micavibrio sp.]|nr:hypothetical protein [Micavibrio sp.]|tara:strand:- start:323 stop:826 length:504 start_codon:yes stop_codon:yes gene_type:complete
MKKALLTLTLLMLTSCGFHPVYGVNRYTQTGVEQYLEQIHIGNIKDQEGQFLRNELIDRFYRNNRPQNPQYTLSIDEINESQTSIDITEDADATRGQLKMNVRFILSDNSSKTELLSRELTSIASYNILTSEFTNRVSEQNARENLIRDIARQIELNIALYFKKNNS